MKVVQVGGRHLRVFLYIKISPSYRNDKPFKTIIATILILHYIKVRECSYINKVLNSRWKMEFNDLGITIKELRIKKYITIRIMSWNMFTKSN